MSTWLWFFCLICSTSLQNGWRPIFIVTRIAEHVRKEILYSKTVLSILYVYFLSQYQLTGIKHDSFYILENDSISWYCRYLLILFFHLGYIMFVFSICSYNALSIYTLVSTILGIIWNFSGIDTIRFQKGKNTMLNLKSLWVENKS